MIYTTCLKLVRAAAIVCIAVTLNACASLAPYTAVSGELARVTETSGVPRLVRRGQPYIVARGSRLYARDTLTTDRYAATTLVFSDQATFHVAPSSRLHIREQRSNGAQQVTYLSQSEGALEVMSWPSDGSHRLEVSAAIAAVTTTTGNLWLNHRLGGSQLDVVLTGQGTIEISNKHGKVVLSKPYESTTVPSGAAPRPVSSWDREKFERIKQRRDFIPETQ